MKHISSETKTNIINRYYNGESIAELTEATGIARSTIYGWLKANRESVKKPVSKKTVNDLNRAVIRLSMLIEILQKVFDVENIPTQIRLEELPKSGARHLRIPFPQSYRGDFCPQTLHRHISLLCGRALMIS